MNVKAGSQIFNSTIVQWRPEADVAFVYRRLLALYQELLAVLENDQVESRAGGWTPPYPEIDFVRDRISTLEMIQIPLADDICRAPARDST